MPRSWNQRINTDPHFLQAHPPTPAAGVQAATQPEFATPPSTTGPRPKRLHFSTPLTAREDGPQPAQAMTPSQTAGGKQTSRQEAPPPHGPEPLHDCHLETRRQQKKKVRQKMKCNSTTSSPTTWRRGRRRCGLANTAFAHEKRTSLGKKIHTYIQNNT